MPLDIAQPSAQDTIPRPLAFSLGGRTVTALTTKDYTFEAFAKLLSTPKSGQKDGSYYLRGGDLKALQRADENLVSAWLIIIDGDSGFNPETGELADAPPLDVVHQALTDMNVTHHIHATHSARPAQGVHKYRAVIPVERLASPDELDACLEYLFDRLHARGVTLVNATENKRWAQLWYLARVPTAEDLPAFQCATHFGEWLDVAACVEWLARRVEQRRKEETLPSAPPVSRTLQGHDSPISQFNDQHGVDWVRRELEARGYRFAYFDKRAMGGAGGHRYTRPNSSTGQPGVVVFTGARGHACVFSHHGGEDPLSGKTHDPFALFALFHHNGDLRAAAREVWKTRDTIAEKIRERDKGEAEAPVNELRRDQGLEKFASYPQESESGAKKDRPRLILSSRDFVAGFKPPEYLIDGMVQKSYLYALTARTGHGKTAVTMHMAQAVARGVPFHGRGTESGAVLILAGENPDDVRARWLVLADHCGFHPDECAVHFIAGVVSIKESMPQIAAEAQEIGPLSMVIVDTAQAYFKGADSNSNAEQLQYAQELRTLTTLPGKPAVLVNCHPTKSAGKDNLYPYGGGSFVNELDGNLTLWSSDTKNTALHHSPDKFRGPGFEPMSFQLETATADAVKDAKGRLMPSVIARPIGDLEVIRHEQEGGDDARKLLAIIGHNGNASQVELARKANWIGSTGQPQKSKVFRVCQALKEDKLVKVVLGKYRITALGKRELGWGDGDGE